jgi:hypothetical protein
MIVRKVGLDKMPTSCESCKFSNYGFECKLTGEPIFREDGKLKPFGGCPLIHVPDCDENKDIAPTALKKRMEKIERLSANGYTFRDGGSFEDEQFNTHRDYRIYRDEKRLSLTLCVKESGRALYQLKQKGGKVLWKTTSQDTVVKWLSEYIIGNADAMARKLSYPYPIFTDAIFESDIPIIAEHFDHFILASTQSDILKIAHDFTQKGFRVAGSVLIENEDKSYTGLELVKGEQL